MTDLYLDPDTGDLALTGTRQVRITASFEEEAIQRLRMRLRRFSGEWFLDASLGVPYRRSVFVKQPDLEVVKTVFTAELLKDAAVSTVTSISLSLDSATRQLSGTCEILLISGEQLELSLGHSTLTDDLGEVQQTDDGTDLIP